MKKAEEYKVPETVEDYTKSLHKMFVQLKLKCNELLSMPTTLANVRMMTACIREARELCKDIAMLQGRLQSMTVIQLTQLNVQFERLTQFLVSEVCERCQKKVLLFLESVKRS